MGVHADAIVGHFNGNDLGHSKAITREGFKVGKDLRDLLVSEPGWRYDRFLGTFLALNRLLYAFIIP